MEDFFQILWPSQNIRTLSTQMSWGFPIEVFPFPVESFQTFRQEFQSENQPASPNNNFNVVSKKNIKSELKKFVKLRGYQRKSHGISY